MTVPERTVWPLGGITVLDLTRVLSGPYCTMMLGDMGARVIKIEHPIRGDDTRAWGPPFLAGESSYFLSVNRNKESVTLDFKHAGRPARARRAHRSRRRARRELPARHACAAGPRLRHARNALPAARLRVALRLRADRTARGGAGLRRRAARRRRADEHHRARPMARPIGSASRSPTSSPECSPPTAFCWRSTRGRRRIADSRSTSRCSTRWRRCSPIRPESSLRPARSPGRMGNRHPSIAPYDTFDAKDGTLVLAVGNDEQWQRFCRVAGLDRAAGDARFTTNESRVRHCDALTAICRWRHARSGPAPSGRRRSSPPACRAGPCGPLTRCWPIRSLPPAKWCSTWLMRRPGSIPLLGIPIKLSATPGAIRRAPPTLGQDTVAVLLELGFGGEEIDALRASGAI